MLDSITMAGVINGGYANLAKIPPVLLDSRASTTPPARIVSPYILHGYDLFLTLGGKAHDGEEHRPFGKRLVPVVTISGGTDLQCISCDDPAVKWAESPVTAPEKPIVLDRV